MIQRIVRRCAALLGASLVLWGSLAGVAAANEGLSGHIVYVNWSGNEIDQMVIDAFQRKYPNVTVEMQNRSSGQQYHENLLVSIATNTAPDLALIDFYEFPSFVAQGLVLDVTEWAERDGMISYLQAELHPAVIGEMVKDGRYYSVANLRTGLDGLFYNKDLFDQAGMAYPSSQVGGWTWQDWEEAARRLTRLRADGTVEQVGLKVHEAFIWSFIRSNGGRLYNDDFTKAAYDEPAAIEAIEWLASLTQSQVLAWNFQSGSFNGGTAAMNVEWVGGLVQTLRNTVAWDWDIAPLPAGKAGSIQTMKGNPVAIPVNAPNPELAWEFMKFLSSEEALAIYGTHGRFFPLHRSALLRVMQESAGLPPRNLATMLEWHAEPLPFVPGIYDIYWMRREQLRPVWQGTVPARNAALQIAELSVGILAEARGGN